MATTRSSGQPESVPFLADETYPVKAGGYESIYVNMPPFGLGKAGDLVSAVGHRKSAPDRLKLHKKGNMPPNRKATKVPPSILEAKQKRN